MPLLKGESLRRTISQSERVRIDKPFNTGFGVRSPAELSSNTSGNEFNHLFTIHEGHPSDSAVFSHGFRRGALLLLFATFWSVYFYFAFDSPGHPISWAFA